MVWKKNLQANNLPPRLMVAKLNRSCLSQNQWTACGWFRKMRSDCSFFRLLNTLMFKKGNAIGRRIGWDIVSLNPIRVSVQYSAKIKIQLVKARHTRIFRLESGYAKQRFVFYIQYTPMKSSPNNWSRMQVDNQEERYSSRANCCG